jgi:hypothetical protein
VSCSKVKYRVGQDRRQRGSQVRASLTLIVPDIDHFNSKIIDIHTYLYILYKYFDYIHSPPSLQDLFSFCRIPESSKNIPGITA